jgi:hypothetical protein
MIDPTAFKVGDLVQFDSEGSKILGLVVGLDNNGIFIDWLSGSQALDSVTCRYHWISGIFKKLEFVEE